MANEIIYEHFCEEVDCRSRAFIKAAKNRPCLALFFLLPDIFEQCKNSCPYYPDDLYMAVNRRISHC